MSKNKAESKKKSEDHIEVNGIVLKTHPNVMFDVQLETGHTILAYLSGKMRMNFIKILPGDKVVVKLSQYDLTKGIIIYREKLKKNNELV